MTVSGRDNAGTLSATEWLGVVEKELVRRFIGRGGAAVRMVSALSPGAAEQVTAGLTHLGQRDRYLVCKVDAAETKTHQIDQLFFAIASEVGWLKTASSFLERLVAKEGYRWPEPGEQCDIVKLAEHNGIQLQIMNRNLDQWLTRDVLRDPYMATSFRTAIERLLRDALSSAQEETPAVVEWLTGRLRLIGAIRRMGIAKKITRHNGRIMLESLTRWLDLAGVQGLIVVIDISPLANPSRSGTIRYTKASRLDGYEVIRQLIDGTGHLRRCFICLVGDEQLLPDTPTGIDCYTALKARVWDDVRDRTRPNPLQAMVTIS